MLFEKQKYQTDCVENILTVLKECDVFNNDFTKLTTAINNLWNDKEYTQFQKSNKNRLDILMETGTGKNFAYLKTIFEINKQYNKNKFIIVVPRTAIKLGVIQTITSTGSYFYQEYKKHLNYIDYPRDGLTKINQYFINNDDFCVLVTTNAAFNSDKNKINKTSENLTPTLFKLSSIWEGINSKNPIIIIDEPHLLKGNETQKGLDKLKNALQIRFGATFPTDKKDKEHHLSNVVYSLDSISSFNQYLVKRIQVDTVIANNEIGSLKLIETKANSKRFSVVYDINRAMYQREILTGEDIGAKTGLKKYKGVSATKVNKDKVFLDNKTILELSKSKDIRLSDEETRQMIRQAIKTHFEKEEALFNKDIKTLSLFFISKIDDFREGENNPKPRVKSIFEKEYKKQRKEILAKTKNKKYKKYLAKDFSEDGKLQVHEGYFSGDKVSTKDKNAGLNKDDIGVDIILNQKEKLLSFDTSLRFIFSVWALQEGWDNPNVFNICKLSNTTKDTSKRQQVGRGLRVALNQSGNRLTYNHLNENEEEFYKINTLDMVVSGHEKDFIHGIQNEIQEASFSIIGDVLTLEILKEKKLNDTETSSLFFLLQQNKIIDSNGKIKSSIHDFLKNQKEKLDFLNLTNERYNKILEIFMPNRQSVIDKKRSMKKVKIRDSKFQEFKELWETINKKANMVYKDIDEENIINEVGKEFNDENIAPVPTKVYKQIYNTQNDSIEIKEENILGEVSFFKTQKFTDFLNFFVKNQKLPFSFMIKLLNNINTQKIKNNPQKARKRLLKIVKETIHVTIIKKVSYKFSETNIYPNSLQNKTGGPFKEIKSTLLGSFYIEEKPPKHLLYDTVCYDSEIEKVNQQNDPQEVNNNKIKVFAKLPKISIPTSYKNYNPDFAYLIETQNEKKLFLVVEAKGYKNKSDIPKNEALKIDYAKKFFKCLQKEIPRVGIQYKTRINKESLTDILKSK